MGHGEPNAELVSTYENQIRQCFDYYEALLAKQTYLAGNVSLIEETHLGSLQQLTLLWLQAYTIIDIFNLPWFAFLEKLDLWHEIEARPHLLAWWKVVSERPAWKAVIRTVP